jgi:multidrug efflux pump subunit AcrB
MDAVVENCEHGRTWYGKKPLHAGWIFGGVGLAVIASAATIICCVFARCVSGWRPGQFFQPFGVTAFAVVYDLLDSWWRVPSPDAGAFLMKRKESKATKELSLLRFPHTFRVRFQPYRGLLTWALRHRLTTVAIALAFFIGSLMLVPLIPKGLIDSGDFGISTVSVELPPGSTLNDAKSVVQEVTQLIQPSPAINSVLATVGSGSGSDGSGVNKATVFVQLKPKQERDISQLKFEQGLRPQFAKIPGARISFQSQGAVGGSKDLSILLKSENPEALTTAANALEKQMRTVPGLVEVSSTASLVKPEILVIPDPARAADLGVTVQAIARTASLATIGDNEANLAKFNLPDRQIPIRVQIDPKARADIETLKNLKVPGQNNTLVPLTAVADIRLGSGPAQIDRYDRARQVSLEANLQGASLGDAVNAVRKLPAMNPLPPGVVEQPAGDAEIMGEIFARFGTAVAVAVLCIYAILVLLYNNFLHPLTIMVALPLSFGGALIGLLIAQKALGLYA